MDISPSIEIRETVQLYCKPLINLCLKNGLSAKDFIEEIKNSYVNVASEEFGIRGREANLSRISIMTGLSRKEVKRLRQRGDCQPSGLVRSASPISRVLAAWHNDPDYLDRSGKPKALTYEGKKNSFKTLARKYIGDIPITAVLRELEKNNLVTEDDQGKILPQSQSFVREGIDRDAVHRMGEVVNELASTICRNFEMKDKKFFERRLLTGKISKEEVLAFHALVSKQGSILLKFLESWLFERGISDIDSDGKGDYRAGVGIFFFEEEDPNTD